MPKDLPGFFFDPERNRYFPLSSASSSSQLNSGHGLRRKRPCQDDSEQTTSAIARPAGNPPSLRILKQNDILCARVASTSRFDLSPASTFGDITEFCSSTSSQGLTRRYLGDNRGWLYTCSLYNEDNLHNQYTTDPDINLHSNSHVSSIRISGQKCVTTCFGPVTKIAVQDINVSGLMTLITLNQIYDVRTSHLQDRELILGAKGKAVYIPDIDISGSVQHLNDRQNSDIFALDRDEFLVYTGARNGSLSRYDLRATPNKSTGRWLFPSRFNATGKSTPPMPSSVLYLKLIRDSQLLVSQMNGKLCMYDTRFPLQDVPIMTFKGHRNSVSPKLGICVDPWQDFLLAAGEDCCIRGWSIRTGKALHSESDAAAESTFDSVTRSDDWGDFERLRNPFKARFPAPVSTMQITEEGDNLCLWVGCQQTLYRYFLGQLSFKT
ncbi:hypothetical protein GYMLUDRAFT_152143 [Collybiopsis luxurians FD-317 M1]|nr:hypothetical protein GYMLUDRAFT_152143 [Collybiopsis luxurians FD-317 M1]